MPSTRAANVRCPVCSFTSRRVPRAGGFGSCSDCGAALLPKQSRAAYLASEKRLEDIANARAVRMLNELHDPRRKLQRVQRIRQTTIKRYGRDYYSTIGSMPKTRKKRCKRTRNKA